VILALVTLAGAGAWEDPDLPRYDLGVDLGVAALRHSTGNHELHPQLGMWFRKGFGSWFGELDLDLATGAELVPGGKMRNSLVRPSLLVGWRGGSRPMHLGLALGVAGSAYLASSPTGSAAAISPGICARMDLHVPVGEHLLLVGSTSGTQRGRSGDFDLSLGGGWRW
jgi:hypothetical protein